MPQTLEATPINQYVGLMRTAPSLAGLPATPSMAQRAAGSDSHWLSD
ncbi:MAG: hypothetical protein KGI32_05360 [Gammaproteobacteria bacterium]|nr:hypothetical protein [Gammaproteobacteria bacterium]MDE1887546.1 hypothetical protein [Gammaproteobacteria bacterium]